MALSLSGVPSERRWPPWWAVCGLPFVLASGLAGAGVDRAELQTAEQLSVQVSFTYDYLLYLPPGYREAATTRWPLVVFLHGLGERGSNVADVKRFGLPHLVDQGRVFPFILVSPQCPDTGWWNAVAVDAFIGKFIETHRVDPDRVYLTGVSMGGYATWAVGMLRPARYAALVPVSGGGEISHAAALKHMPIWAFHGARDAVVEPGNAVRLVQAVTAAGGKPRLTLIPDAPHNIWDETYNNPALFPWLLAQRRTESRETSCR